MTTQISPEFVRPRQAAEMLGISRSKLYELIRAGEFTVAKLGPRITLVDVESVRAWKRRMLVQAAQR